MDVRQARSNDSIAKLVESIPRQLKPISLSKVDFPKKRRKKKKTYKSIGLFWDDYEILL